jgi:hypothetical protein
VKPAMIATVRRMTVAALRLGVAWNSILISSSQCEDDAPPEPPGPWAKPEEF